jgi:hypothetical protein
MLGDPRCCTAPEDIERINWDVRIQGCICDFNGVT